MKDMAKIVTPELVKAKAEAKKQTVTIIEQAKTLTIHDADDYETADGIRTTLKAASKKWTDRLQLIIRPAYESLQSLYSLKNEIVQPMDEAAEEITKRMKEYKQEETRKLREQQRKEEEELRRKEEEARARLEAAKTKAAKSLIRRQLDQIEDQATNYEAPQPVAAAGSNTRTVLKWKVGDMKKLLKAVIAGDIPEDVIEINTVVMNDYFKGDDSDNKDMIRTWPGVEVYEDIQIVSKR